MQTRTYYLVLNQDAYRRVVRELLERRSGFGIGTIRSRMVGDGEELIVATWAWQAGLPDARRLPPLHAFAVIELNDSGMFDSMETRVHLERTQRLVAISIDSRFPDRLQVSITCGGTTHPPMQVQFIGSRMAIAIRETPLDREATVSHKQSLRHSRTRGALQANLSDKLEEARLLIVGAGAGGSALSWGLASRNPAQMVLCDGDRVGPENLDNLPHATEKDARLKRLKVAVSIKALHRYQPEIRLLGLPHRIQDRPAIEFVLKRRFTAVFSFVDNVPAKLATSRLCAAGHMVHIDLGSHIAIENGDRVMRGDVRLFMPGGRGCIACVPRLENIETVLYQMATPRGCLELGPAWQWNELRAGTLSHLNQLMVSLAIDLWERVLDGRQGTSHWIRVHWPFGSLPTIQGADVEADSACVFCQRAK